MRDSVGYIRLYGADAKRVFGVLGNPGIYEMFVDGGIVRVKKLDNVANVNERGYGQYKDIKLNLGERHMGDRDFFKGVDYDLVLKLIFRMDGKEEVELIDAIKEWKEKREERQRAEAEQMDEWRALKERFGGMVIGLDRKVDTYEDGFSVRVLLRSGASYKERKEFVREKKREMLRWIMEELKGNKKIGDIRFYKPVEICVLKAPEVDVKFEVKKVG